LGIIRRVDRGLDEEIKKITPPKKRKE